MAVTIRQRLAKLTRSLASLRLAVVVLGTLAVVLAAATIYESKYGSQAAQRDIYQAAWFDLLLVLLGLNVLASAVIRWPWSPRLAGFAITHLAILLILGGCLTTRWFGVTGRVAIQEGGQDNAVTQDGWVIRVIGHEGASMAETQVPIQEPPQPGTTVPFVLAGQSYQLDILRYLPDAEAKMQLVEGAPEDPAGVLVEIQEPAGAAAQSSSMRGHGMQQWLLVDDAAQWALRTAGFSLTAADRYTPPSAPTTMPAKGILVATINGQDHEVNVEQAMAAPVAVDGDDTKVQVKEYYDRAVVQQKGKLQEDPSRPMNPAVVVELTQGGKTERRTVFARFGDIRGMHGAAGGDAVRLSLHHSMAGETGLKVVLVPQQDGYVLYEQKDARLVQQVAVKPGTPVTLQGMPLSLVVTQQLAHARAGRVVTERKGGESANPQPAIEARLDGPAGPQQEWLAWSQPAVFAAGKQAMQLTFQQKHVSLPFTLQLERFEMEQYPGTNMPAMYRSRLKVIDPRRSEQRTAVIEMNKPLEYDGWSFFQSSYSMNGRQRVSILSASKDPGQPIVYWGSTLLILGTVVIAIQRLKALSGKAGNARPTAAARVASKVANGVNHA